MSLLPLLPSVQILFDPSVISLTPTLSSFARPGWLARSRRQAFVSFACFCSNPLCFLLFKSLITRFKFGTDLLRVIVGQMPAMLTGSVGIIEIKIGGDKLVDRSRDLCRIWRIVKCQRDRPDGRSRHHNPQRSGNWTESPN